MIRLLFVVALTQALPHYSAYPTASHDQMEGTKSVSTSLSVQEGKIGAGPMVSPQPIPPAPQPIAVDIIDSNTGQKLNAYNMFRLVPYGYQQPGIQPYSMQYLAFDGYPTPYGNGATNRESHFMNYGYPMQLVQFPQYSFPVNGMRG